MSTTLNRNPNNCATSIVLHHTLCYHGNEISGVWNLLGSTGLGGKRGVGGAETVTVTGRGRGGADAATPKTSCSNLHLKIILKNPNNTTH